MSNKLNLDAFINNAVKQVKDSKKKGSIGRKARRALDSDVALFEAKKLEIYELGQRALAQHWKPAAFVQYVSKVTCPCCKQIEYIASDSIYLETVDCKGGRITRRLQDIEGSVPRNLPRRVDHLSDLSATCLACFVDGTWAAPYTSSIPKNKQLQPYTSRIDAVKAILEMRGVKG